MIEVRWRPRHDPLRPVAAAVSGAAARRLVERLLEDDERHRLTGVASDRGLVVVAGDQLPWVDGVLYLGRSEAAPALLLPTALEPTVPEALLEQAVSRQVGRVAPVAVIPAPPLLVPVAAARPLSAPVLRHWLAAR